MLCVAGRIVVVRVVAVRLASAGFVSGRIVVACWPAECYRPGQAADRKTCDRFGQAVALVWRRGSNRSLKSDLEVESVSEINPRGRKFIT